MKQSPEYRPRKSRNESRATHSILKENNHKPLFISLSKGSLAEMEARTVRKTDPFNLMRSAGDVSEIKRLMPLNIEKIRNEKQVGFFDGHQDRKENPWSRIQRFLCNSQNERNIIDLCAREYNK